MKHFWKNSYVDVPHWRTVQIWGDCPVPQSLARTPITNRVKFNACGKRCCEKCVHNVLCAAGEVARLVFVSELTALLIYHGHHGHHPGELLLHHLAAVGSDHCSSRLLFMAQTNSKIANWNCYQFCQLFLPGTIQEIQWDSSSDSSLVPW